MRQRTVRVGVTLLCLSLLQGVACCGTNSNSAKFYGQGVHQFFQGQYADAIRDFDIAVRYDSEDARIYFFRGIAKDRIGATAEAADDLQRGARLEALIRRSNVGRSLQRIQGPERLKVEHYRREARKLDRQVLMSLMQDLTAPQVVESPKPPTKSSAGDVRVQFEALSVDETDPFANDLDGFLLGRGKIERVDHGTVEADSFAVEDGAFEVGGEEPFGTGVDTTAGSDVFGDGGFVDAADVTADVPTARSSPDKPGVIGAALRAFGRSLAPSIPNVPVAVPGLQPAGASSVDGPGGFGEDDDFDMPQEADPFGDNFGDDQAPAENGDEEFGDPFQDDDF